MSAEKPPMPGDFDEIESYRLAFCKFVCENPEFAKLPEFADELHKLRASEFTLRRSPQDLFENSFWPEIELQSSSDEIEQDLTKPSSETPKSEFTLQSMSSTETIPSADSSCMTDGRSLRKEPLIESSVQGIQEDIELQKETLKTNCKSSQRTTRNQEPENCTGEGRTNG